MEHNAGVKGHIEVRVNQRSNCLRIPNGRQQIWSEKTWSGVECNTLLGQWSCNCWVNGYAGVILGHPKFKLHIITLQLYQTVAKAVQSIICCYRCSIVMMMMMIDDDDDDDDDDNDDDDDDD